MGMRKGSLLKFALLCAAALTLASCISSYYIHKEAPMNAKPADKFKSFYVGWLDMHADDYEKYGYATQKEWADVIHDQNINGLQKYMKDVFPDKTLYFAGPNDKGFPTKGDLYIKFDVDRIDKNWNGFSGGADDLYVDVTFFDVKTKEKLYSSSINTTSMGMGPQGWAFEGRLGFAIYNLTCFVYDKLYE